MLLRRRYKGVEEYKSPSFYMISHSATQRSAAAYYYDGYAYLMSDTNPATSLKINMNNDAVTTFNIPSSDEGANGWYKIYFAAAPNGYFYFAPNSASNILKVSISNLSNVTAIGTTLPVTGYPKFSNAGVLLTNNLIYYSFGATAAGGGLWINHTNDTYTYNGAWASLSYSRKSFLGQNNMIYETTRDLGVLLATNPSTKAVTNLGSVGSTLYGGKTDSHIIMSNKAYNYKNSQFFDKTYATHAYSSYWYASNGLVYAIPYNSGVLQVLKFNTNSIELIEELTLPSTWNKTVRQIGTYTPSGKIYIRPEQNDAYGYTCVINTYATLNPSSCLIPSDLSTLPTSNYNIYFN